jgi:hypothetical protein
MSGVNEENDQDSILQLTDDPVVLNAVTLKAVFVAAEQFAKHPWIGTTANAFIEKIPNLFCGGWPHVAEIFQREFVNSVVPAHARLL